MPRTSRYRVRGRRLSAYGLFIFALAMLGGGAAAARPLVSAAHVQDLPAATRIVLDLDRSVGFKLFRLDNPDRVVIDLSRVRWRVGQSTVAVTSSLVRRLRYGLFNPDTSRVVIDCHGPARIKSAKLAEREAGQRLIIDLIAVKEGNNGHRLPAARTTGSGRPGVRVGWSLPPASRKPRPPGAPRVVVIDPGHGGADPGATGVSGVREKTITLAAARRLRDHLERAGGYKVVLTRDRDVYIRLRERIEIARAAGAAVFLSLHADAHPSARIRGASVYTLSERASDAEAAALAERENKADLIAGVDLTRETPEVANILIDLARRETRNQSSQLASLLVGELKRRTRLLRKSHRFAGFAVLKAPDVPSVLVELGYLSNRQDEKQLRNAEHLETLAEAMAQAIDAYFADATVAGRL